MRWRHTHTQRMAYYADVNLLLSSDSRRPAACSNPKDKLDIAIRSLRLVVLASFSILYGKVPRLIVKKTNRLTQAVVFFRRHFLCGALLRNCSSAEREGLSPHVPRECSAEPFMRSVLSLKNLHISPRCSPTIFYRDANSVLLLAHLCTAVLIGSMRRTPCSKVFMRRA